MMGRERGMAAVCRAHETKKERCKMNLQHSLCGAPVCAMRSANIYLVPKMRSPASPRPGTM